MPSRQSLSPSARRSLVYSSLLFLALTSFVFALALGAVDIPLGDVSSALLLSDSSNRQIQLIVNELRLPRALLAAATGATLALCGAVTQGLFRNPLADPSLIGVSAGASLGGSLVLFFGLQSLSLPAVLSDSLWNLSLVSLGAFIGGSLSVLIVYRFSNSIHGTSVSTMLLIGIAISAIAGSASNLLEYFSDDLTLRRISLWRMGGLDGANFTRAGLVSVVLVSTLMLLSKKSHELNAMLLGESEARHLGINVARLKTQLILLVAAGIGLSVAVAGAIGFVGLVVPHFIRLLIGPNHKYLLPASALGGAVLLIVADTLARTALAPSELPVGILTALIGAPVFISLLKHRKNYGF